MFPKHPVFQVRFVELLLLGAQEGTAHTISSSSPPLRSCTRPAVAKVVSPCAPPVEKTLSANRWSVSWSRLDTGCILHTLV